MEHPAGILPLCYFPPVSWWAAALALRGPLLLEAWQPYQKQQLSSRAHIRTANRVLPLTVLVARRDSHAPLALKQVSFAENWPRQHWRTLETAYRNAPYFEYYADGLRALLEAPPEQLADLLMATVSLAGAWLREDFQWQLTAQRLPPGAVQPDLRTAFDPSLRSLPPWFRAEPYAQVFGGFSPGLSILDLVFNLGPEAPAWLRRAASQAQLS